MEKIKMFAAKANQMDHRMGLKTVKKFDVKEDEKKDEEKPEWAAGTKPKESKPAEATEAAETVEVEE